MKSCTEILANEAERIHALSVTVTEERIEINAWPDWLRPALIAGSSEGLIVDSAAGVVDAPVGAVIEHRDHMIMVLLPFTGRLCPFCKTGQPELHVDACREQETGLPMSALVYCGTCGAHGPTYVRPLVYLKGEAIDRWDPRERAVAAWNGEVDPDGCDGPPMRV